MADPLRNLTRSSPPPKNKATYFNHKNVYHCTIKEEEIKILNLKKKEKQ